MTPNNMTDISCVHRCFRIWLLRDKNVNYFSNVLFLNNRKIISKHIGCINRVNLDTFICLHLLTMACDGSGWSMLFFVIFYIKNGLRTWAWWHNSRTVIVILELRRQMQENCCKVEVNLICIGNAKPARDTW